MRDTKRRQQDAGVYLPTRQAIAAACSRVHESWSERVAVQRTVQRTGPVEVMVIPVTREIAEALGDAV
jgi:hypothetical protein